MFGSFESGRFNTGFTVVPILFVFIINENKGVFHYLNCSFFQDPKGIPWIDESRVSDGIVDARKALEKFQQWSEANRQQLSNYDAIMMFTRFVHMF